MITTSERDSDPQPSNISEAIASAAGTLSDLAKNLEPPKAPAAPAAPVVKEAEKSPKMEIPNKAGEIRGAIMRIYENVYECR